MVGAGVQGRAHLEAFAEGLGVREVWWLRAARPVPTTLVAHALSLGLQARRVDDADAALAHCPWWSAPPAPSRWRCGPNRATVPLWPPWAAPHGGGIGPRRVPPHRRHRHPLVVDTRDADHEAGDLIQAGLDMGRIATLSDVVGRRPGQRPVSCGGLDALGSGAIRPVLFIRPHPAASSAAC